LKTAEPETADRNDPFAPVGTEVSIITQISESSVQSNVALVNIQYCV